MITVSKPEQLTLAGPFRPRFIKRDALGRAVATARFGTMEGSKRIIEMTVLSLGVTKYQLGKLIGVPFPSTVYSWGNRWRISPVFLERIICLYERRARGVFDPEIPIDWDRYKSEV